jgi:hypothetical protein
MADNTIGALGELMLTSPPDIDKEASAVKELGAELRAGKRRVFFYAASGFDWQPLHRFSHLCDCFVYVDPRSREPVWGRTAVEFEIERIKLEYGETRAGENLRGAQLLGFDEAYRILTEVVGPLAEMRNEPWPQIQDLQNRPAWGAVQKLKRRVGGKDRIVWLVFIAGSPLVVYRKLFIETGAAPVCLALCVPRLVAWPSSNRTAMERLDGLGRRTGSIAAGAQRSASEAAGCRRTDGMADARVLVQGHTMAPPVCHTGLHDEQRAVA